MTDTPREWIDIDTEWLQNYLEQRDLAHAFELDDELLAAQASWILGAEEWEMLRAAWEAQAGGTAPERPEDAESAPRAPTHSGEADREPEIPGSSEAGEAAGRDDDASPTAEPATAQIAAPPDDRPRLHELARTALGDWGAFRELFRDWPKRAEIDTWEALADSPVALLRHAAKLTAVRQAKLAGLKRQTDQELEQEVSRVRNSIAGYYLYCRKHRLKPSLDHLLDFIPVLRTDHPPAAVEEAWRRERETQEDGER